MLPTRYRRSKTPEIVYKPPVLPPEINLPPHHQDHIFLFHSAIRANNLSLQATLHIHFTSTPQTQITTTQQSKCNSPSSSPSSSSPSVSPPHQQPTLSPHQAQPSKLPLQLKSATSTSAARTSPGATRRSSASLRTSARRSTTRRMSEGA